MTTPATDETVERYRHWADANRHSTLAEDMAAILARLDAEKANLGVAIHFRDEANREVALLRQQLDAEKARSDGLFAELAKRAEENAKCRADAALLDWLNSRGQNCAFGGVRQGFRWEVLGSAPDLREAISAMKASQE